MSNTTEMRDAFTIDAETRRRYGVAPDAPLYWADKRKTAAIKEAGLKVVSGEGFDVVMCGHHENLILVTPQTTVDSR